MDVITIIAYKSDGHTSCRGCVMDSWGAELEVCVFTAVTDAANFIAARLHDNDTTASMDNRDTGFWEIDLLINGKHTWAFDNLVEQDYSPELTEEEEGLVKLVKSWSDLAVTKLREERDQRILRLAKEAEEKRLREEGAERERRRQEYEKLKKEFGS